MPASSSLPAATATFITHSESFGKKRGSSAEVEVVRGSEAFERNIYIYIYIGAFIIPILVVRVIVA